MKYLKILLIIFLVLTVAFAVDFLTGYSIHSDVRYGDKDVNTMDFYLPRDLDDVEGAVLFIHGGSWSGGDKAEEDVRCRIVANAGYLSATMNYTLLSDANDEEYTVDVVLNEIDLAIKQMVTFAAEQGITLEGVGVSGYSAGAHLAMLYSYSRGDSAPVEIAFVSSMAGPADISAEVWSEHSAMVIGDWLGEGEITPEMMESGEALPILAEISPVTHVSESSPPTMLIHGGRDQVVPLKNAENLMARLDECGVEHDFILLPDSDHSLLQNPVGHLKYYLLLLEYCKTYL